jgi:hypothetical protein
MSTRGMVLGVLRRVLLAAAVVCPTGCLSFVHPVAPPDPHLLQSCHAAPQCCRDHVYIFMVHGLDPLNLCNLSGVRDYLHQLGFTKTYYGQLYHAWQFENKLQRIHQDDPQAHVILIGFSYGANVARHLAHVAQREDVPVDLLVYLGGNTLHNVPDDQPENAGHIVNVLASGFIWNGADFDRGENIHVTDVWHFGSPTHPRTLEALGRGMALVAASLPVPEPSPPAEDLGPTPRPMVLQPRKQRGEWDFLQPSAEVPVPTIPEKSVESKPGIAHMEKAEP